MHLSRLPATHVSDLRPCAGRARDTRAGGKTRSLHRREKTEYREMAQRWLGFSATEREALRLALSAPGAHS